MWSLFYGAVGITFLWRSFIVIPLADLIVFACIGIILMFFEWIVVAHQAQKTAASEVMGTCGVLLVAPYLYAALNGGIEWAAILLWFLLALHFVLGVLYVRIRIRSTRDDILLPDFSAKLWFALPTIVFAAVSLGIILVIYVSGLISTAIVFAFFLGLPRLFVGFQMLGQKFVIKRLGWSEVAHSVLFAIILGWSGL